MKPDAPLHVQVSEDGDVHLITTDPEDTSVVTDSIDVGRDGTRRRYWLLSELALRDGLYLTDNRGKRIVP